MWSDRTAHPLITPHKLLLVFNLDPVVEWANNGSLTSVFATRSPPETNQFETSTKYSAPFKTTIYRVTNVGVIDAK